MHSSGKGNMESEGMGTAKGEDGRKIWKNRIKEIIKELDFQHSIPDNMLIV